MRNKKGQFVKGFAPENKGKGRFKKGHKGLLTHPNKTSFKKGGVSWNKGKKGVLKANKGSFKKGNVSHNKGKRCPNISGKNHWNWKGGITNVSEKIRKCFKYRQWRSDVFTRDNFTCQECGVRGCYLEAHHIEEFCKIIAKYKIKTIEDALNCTELWNINNGVTLCKNCHSKTKNGRKS